MKGVIRKTLVALVLLTAGWTAQAQATLREGMRQLEHRYGVSFVYDAKLPVEHPYGGRPLDGRKLETNLDRLFRGSGIEWRVRGKSVILKAVQRKDAAGTAPVTPVVLDSAKIVDSRQPLLSETQPGRLDLPARTVWKMPVLFGERDVLKSLQLLPGVQPVHEGFSGISVRGGYADENLILRDGIPLYGADHMLGVISVFMPESVREVSLYKSAFPARFGGRASGVIDVRTADGNASRLRGSLTVGLLTDKLHLDGPVGERTTFSISGRILHTVLAEPVLKQLDRSTNYWFHDLDVSVKHRLGAADALRLTAYSGQDRYRRDERSKTPEPGAGSVHHMAFGWGNTLAALSWLHEPGSGPAGETTLAWTKYKSGMDLRNENGSTAAALRSQPSLQDFTLRSDWTAGRFRFGGSYILHRVYWGGEQSDIRETVEGRIVRDTTFVLAAPEVIPLHEAAVYGEAGWSLSPSVRLDAGLRLTLYHTADKTFAVPEPRLSLRWDRDSRWTAHASYTRMSQGLLRLSSSMTTLPLEPWMPVSGARPPIVADQWSIGGAWHGLPGWSFSAEAYYKGLQNVVDYTVSYHTFVSSDQWKRMTASGQGRSYGVELLAQKTAGRLTGWLGYTLSRSDRIFPDGRVNRGIRYPAVTDRRHRINLMADYALTRRTDFTASWTFASGAPVTLPSLKADVSSEDGIRNIRYAPLRGNDRFPPIHRLDISITVNKELRRGSRSWSFGMYNLYGARNPDLGWFSSVEESEATEKTPAGTLYYHRISLLRFIPSVSFTRSF